jgi:hypothetical protein
VAVRLSDKIFCLSEKGWRHFTRVAAKGVVSRYGQQATSLSSVVGNSSKYQQPLSRFLCCQGLEHRRTAPPRIVSAFYRDFLCRGRQAAQLAQATKIVHLQPFETQQQLSRYSTQRLRYVSQNFGLTIDTSLGAVVFIRRGGSGTPKMSHCLETQGWV